MSVDMEQVADRPAPGARDPLVRITGVKKYFPITQGIIFQREVGRVHAVDGVDLEVFPGETLGIVGETGCGKSTLARLICRLLDVTEGRIEFDGQDITSLKGDRLRQLRREIQMIFQDPYSSLNPRKRVGAIIGDPFEIHGLADGKEQKRRVQELMETVGLNPEHYNRFPAEFSGGQRQRIGVARALALRPKLIICDEPVSALDVSIQAQVINLLEDLQEEFKLTYIFIAHDLSVVRHVCDRVAVMYLGKVVELADARRLYAEPKHPYSGALLSAVPVPDPDLAERRERVILLGDVPSPIDPPSGCRFRTRCPKAQERCIHEVPPLEPKAAGDLAACHFPLEPGENLARARAGIEQDPETTVAVAQTAEPPPAGAGG
jgi:oligopeptide/dipeptide ABC transporter ATP-binding protein